MSSEFIAVLLGLATLSVDAKNYPDAIFVSSALALSTGPDFPLWVL